MSPRVNTKTNTRQPYIDLSVLIGRYLMELLPIAAFLFVSMLPAEALASMSSFEEPMALMLPITPVYDGAVRPGAVLGVTSTAYSSTVGQTDSSPLITASGTRVRPGVAAANFLPIGTRVKVDGVIYTIEDRMNARFGNRRRIDIWHGSTESAREYGVRKQVVEVVSLPN